MNTRRSGFSLVELLVVIVTGSIALGIGVDQFKKVADRRAVWNARDAFISTVHRARSEAMRTGRLVHLSVQPGSGLVEVAMAGGTLHTLDLGTYGVTMTASTASVCYAARGYALPGCTSVTAETPVEFTRGAAGAAVSLLPLGQVRRPE